ncbi:hypothetical protein DW322_13255 [Rhodococcus rhodnii]|uniref:Uncharacterized protein n=2 Tax=Rhodococcus rhodnii TaxID=38312 RepID=R7WKN9_9NOCA|nr:hypothetical protein [Rhodococcus rhodnii]EOM75840.1 hypothetical protein Rrhod_2746 [Rhodococcus rhodnii LMG 5362]TXG91015.1 hypothetical protein DW322_13255 [Rhodococcus rhodnii]
MTASLTIGNVRSWRPTDIDVAARGISELGEFIDGAAESVEADQNALAETWSGEAAVAAGDRVVDECRMMTRIRSELLELAEAYSNAARALDRAQTHVDNTVSAATAAGFDVDVSGRARPMTAGVVDPAGFAQLQSEADAHTEAIHDALRQAADVANDVAKILGSAVDTLDDSVAKARVGTVEATAEGFSWEPDWPATAAATIVSGMSDATARGLTTAAAAVGDDVARNIGRGLGPAGAILGTIPAIHNDIAGGMDPTKAVVTEGAGAVAGLGIGALSGLGASAATGALVGSAVPGVGTVVGFVVGAGFGAFASWGVSKGLQNAWD